MKFKLIILLILVIILGCSEDSTNPNDNLYGILQGNVIDSTGNPISNVEIYTNPPSEVFLTNSEGEFYFKKLPVGKFEVIAKKNGYNAKTVLVNIIANNTTKATIILNTTSVNNTKPNTPILISPSINSTHFINSIELKWSCSDPENQILKYKIFLDNVNPPTKVLAEETYETTFKIENLEFDKNYYWKIQAEDTYGEINISSVANFTIKTFDMEQDKLLDMRFNNNFVDNSVFNRNTTNFNVNFSYDRNQIANSAASFNGYSYLRVDNTNSLDFSKPFTIALWVYPDATYGNSYEGEVDLVSRYGKALANTSSFAFLIKYGKLTAEVYNNNWGRAILSTNEVIKPNEWSFVTLVYDGTKLILYKNAVLIDQTNVVKPDISSLPLNIGMRSENNRIFKGIMDDILIYGKALTKENLELIYNAK